MELTKEDEILSTAKIKLTLRYSVHRQTLVIHAHCIDNLSFDDEKCVYLQTCISLDKLKDTERKSKVITTSKNPVFDQKFEYAIPQEELDRKHLEVFVVEKNDQEHLPIAQVTIDLNHLGLVLPYTRFYRLYKSTTH